MLRKPRLFPALGRLMNSEQLVGVRKQEGRHARDE